MFVIFLLFNTNMSSNKMQKAIKEDSIKYLIIYYHSFDYPDIGRSVQSLKTNLYEWKYSISYKEVYEILDKSFFDNTFEICYDEKIRKFKLLYGAQILIELYNQNDDIIAWYSFDESDREFILLNSKLYRINEESFRKLEALIDFIKLQRTK